MHPKKKIADKLGATENGWRTCVCVKFAALKSPGTTHESEMNSVVISFKWMLWEEVHLAEHGWKGVELRDGYRNRNVM